MSAGVMELPRISIKSDVKRAEAKPFVGIIRTDTLQPSKFDPDKKPFQWVLAVEPIRNAAGTAGFKLGGKTGAFWEYISISNDELAGDIKDQSKFGRHLKAFQAAFGNDDDRAIGRNEYVEEAAWFIRDEVTYGTNKTTGEPIKSTVLLPQRRLTPEEMVEYGLAAAGAVDLAAGLEFSTDELEALAAALDGTDRNAIQKRAHQKRLGQKLIAGVGKGNGPAIDQAIAAGLGQFDGDVFRKAA
jgi:hypothetical protein